MNASKAWIEQQRNVSQVAETANLITIFFGPVPGTLGAVTFRKPLSREKFMTGCEAFGFLSAQPVDLERAERNIINQQ